MSTILKALRRLEREKTQHLHRPLREEVAGGPEPGRAVSIPLVAAAVFAAGLGIGAVLLFLWPWTSADLASESELAAREPAPQRPEERREARRRERPSPSDLPPTSVLAPQPVPSPAPLELPAAALVSKVEVVRRIEPPPLPLNEDGVSDEPRPLRPGEIRPGAQALKPKSARAPTPVARAEPHVPARAVATSAAPPAPRAATPELGAAPKPPASPPAQTQPLAPERQAPKPRPAPAPEQVADSPVPAIVVSRTHWHPQSDKREAFLEVGGDTEPMRVREGDSVGPLVVQEIEPSGVVFQHAGEEVRRAVGVQR